MIHNTQSRWVSTTALFSIFAIGCIGPSAGNSGDDGPLTTGVALPTASGGADGAAAEAGGNPADGTGNGDNNDSSSIKLDVNQGDGTGQGGDGGDDCTPTPTNAVIRGTVFAPNLEIPISGALVYTTPGDAEPVPDGVYCAECVQVACNEHFVLTNPDGSFELPANAGPGQKLVVQKGQFLHVADIDINAGDNTATPEMSNLPGEWDPANGMWIPRIAVVESNTDSIFNVLGKIGLGEVGATGALNPGTERFDLLPQNEGGALLDDIDAMRKYHIIFVPCMAQNGMGTLSAQRLENIRQWVSEGGKWYVTDWANEYLYESFPNYQTLHSGGFIGNFDLGSYNTEGRVLDPALLAWLEALPPTLQDIGGGLPDLLSLPTVELEDNWSGIETIPPVMVTDAAGMMVDVGHHPWVEGPCLTCDGDDTLARPMTISASYGCGRIMFSTYHTNETAHAGLTPQELILFYIILEIGVCHETPPPPPPPIG